MHLLKIIKYFLSNFQQKNNNYIVKYTIIFLATFFFIYF